MVYKENDGYKINKLFFNIMIAVIPFIIGALVAWGATRSDVGNLKKDVKNIKKDYEQISEVLWKENRGGIVAMLARMEANQKIIMKKLDK